MVFVKENLTEKHPQKLETNVSQTICLKLTITEKKWVYNLHIGSQIGKKNCFSVKLSYSLNNIANRHEIIDLSGDLNIEEHL